MKNHLSNDRSQSVRQRCEDFERKQKENSKKENFKNFHSTRWSVRSHGRFTKEVQDSRGVPPKRRLSDLP